MPQEWNFVHLYCPAPILQGNHGAFLHPGPNPPEKCPLCGATLGKLNAFAGGIGQVVDKLGWSRIRCGHAS